MKIFGHPLHMMLIHFPVALFPVEFICYGIFYYSGDISFGHSAYYAMLGGVLLGWIAIITGAADMFLIPAEKGNVKVKALIHGSINAMVVIGYTAFAYPVYKNFPNILSALLFY